MSQAMDSALKDANRLNGMQSGGGGGSDADSNRLKFERKQAEDRMRLSLAAAFENLISKSENEVKNFRMNFNDIENITYFYHTYFSGKVNLLIFLLPLTFFVGTSSFFLFAAAFPLIAYAILAGTHARAFFEIYSRNLKTKSEYREIIYSQTFPRTVNLAQMLKIVIILSTAALAQDYILNGLLFLKISFFDIKIFWNYAGEHEIFAILNMSAIAFLLYAKAQERWSL